MADQDDTVELTDLEVIQQFSLAVRGAKARRSDVIAALEADLAYLGGRGATSTSKAATMSLTKTAATPAPRVQAAPVRTVAKAAPKPAAKAPAKPAAKAPAKPAAKAPAKKATRARA